MKIALIIVYLFIATVPLCAQKVKVNLGKAKAVLRCKLDKAPTLRGFFLGQTVDQIEKIVPGFRKEYDQEFEDGSSSIHQTDYLGEMENRLEWRDVGAIALGAYIDENQQLIFNGYLNPRKLAFNGDAEGINQIAWYFSDEKLYAYAIYYSDYTPDTARDFAKQLSRKTDLPAQGWLPTDKADIGSVLQCQGFKVNVHIAYRNFANVTVTDTKIENQILATEKAIKAQRRKDELERRRREEEKAKILKP